MYVCMYVCMYIYIYIYIPEDPSLTLALLGEAAHGGGANTTGLPSIITALL